MGKKKHIYRAKEEDQIMRAIFVEPEQLESCAARMESDN